MLNNLDYDIDLRVALITVLAALVYWLSAKPENKKKAFWGIPLTIAMVAIPEIGKQWSWFGNFVVVCLTLGIAFLMKLFIWQAIPTVMEFFQISKDHTKKIQFASLGVLAFLSYNSLTDQDVTVIHELRWIFCVLGAVSLWALPFSMDLSRTQTWLIWGSIAIWALPFWFDWAGLVLLIPWFIVYAGIGVVAIVTKTSVDIGGSSHNEKDLIPVLLGGVIILSGMASLLIQVFF